MSVGVDAHIDPAECNCKIAPYHRQNRTTHCRGGRPCPPVGQLRVCRNVSSNRTCPVRGERGIDPYKRIAYLHRCVCIRGYILPGGQGRPPLRVRACSHWCVRVCNVVLPGGVEPLPYGNFVRSYEVADGASRFAGAYRTILSSRLRRATSLYTREALDSASAGRSQNP